MVDVEIRPVLPREYGDLGRLTVRSYRQLVGGAALGPYEDELLDVAARAADCVVLVAVDNDTVLGGVTYVPSADRAMSEFQGEDAAGIRMLAVDPAHQGIGAGRALVEACISLGRKEGRTRLCLHSTPAMAVARALYLSLGFVRLPSLDLTVEDPPYSQSVPLELLAFELVL